MISEGGSVHNDGWRAAEGGFATGAGAAPPPPPQLHKRHLFRKILLTVAGTVVVLFAAFLGLGFYVNHQKAVAAASAAANAAPAAPRPPDLGVPLYPGAILAPAGVSTTVSQTGTEVTATYDTADSPGQVAQFYQQQGNGVQVINIPDGSEMISAGVVGNTTSIIVVPNNGQTVIHYDHGRTTTSAPPPPAQ